MSIHHSIPIREVLQTRDLEMYEIVNGDYEWFQHEMSERCGLVRSKPISINDILPARIVDITFTQGADGQGGLGLTALFLDNGWKIVSSIYGSPEDLIEIITKGPGAKKYLIHTTKEEIIGQVLNEHIRDPISNMNIFRLENYVLLDPACDNWLVADERSCIWDV